MNEVMQIQVTYALFPHVARVGVTFVRRGGHHNWKTRLYMRKTDKYITRLYQHVTARPCRWRVLAMPHGWLAVREEGI